MRAHTNPTILKLIERLAELRLTRAMLDNAVVMSATALEKPSKAHVVLVAKLAATEENLDRLRHELEAVELRDGE